MNMKLYYFTGTIIWLSFFLDAKQVYAQSAIDVSAEQICKCLNEKVKSDTLNLTSKEIFDSCTGETMAKNGEKLSKEFNLGTVEGIIQLRNEFIDILKKDCDRFRKMFVKNKEENK